jgi:hypothetical protein
MANRTTATYQSDGVVTWHSSLTGNTALLTLGGDGLGDQWVAAGKTSQERIVSTLTAGAGNKLFAPCLESTDTYLRLSYETYMNNANPWLTGIWMDGQDPNVVGSDNEMPNSEVEIAVQFGARSGTSTTTPYNRGFRVRGANGAPDTYSGTKCLDPNIWSADLWNLKLDLYVDLAAAGGDGLADLYVTNMDNGYSTRVITGAALGLNSQADAYRNPANWSGWTVRNQGTGSDLFKYTVDNLTLNVLPEPATLSLLVLGGLACLRRRR